jgi:bifunctional UDP-N-acetylglucosamine pyrophosphorylase/glucosamine-1-phosphate N-acetyltransferase
MVAPVVVILAAGHGTRMRSATPKVLHPVCGRPMVLWAVQAARHAGAGRVVVVGGPDGALRDHLPDDVALAVQPVADGTGGAVAAAAEHLRSDDVVVVLHADVPLVPGGLIRALVDAHAGSGAAATMATMVLDDPAAYGRVVRGADGQVERVVEVKPPAEPTPEELALREVNTGLLAFTGGPLVEALAQVGSANAQRERYLPDVLPILRAAGHAVRAHVVDDPAVTLGINDRVDLARVSALAQAAILEAHMRAGVTVVDPARTLVEVGVEIAPDAVLQPDCCLRGATRIGPSAEVGPGVTALGATIGARARVVHAYLDGAEVGEGATVGPYAYLRPGTVLAERAKAGTFVEVKNSRVGARSKVPHLSYVGDADIGEDTNLGAATITANYDGRAKHPTTIGARVRTSVDTTLVAPVRVGDDAYTGAGSVITEDVPPGALGIARARQRNIEGYAERRRG